MKNLALNNTIQDPNCGGIVFSRALQDRTWRRERETWMDGRIAFSRRPCFLRRPTPPALRSDHCDHSNFSISYKAKVTAFFFFFEFCCFRVFNFNLFFLGEILLIHFF